VSSSTSDPDRLPVSFAPVVAQWFSELKTRAQSVPDGRDAAAYRSLVRIVSEIIADRAHAFDVRYRLRDALASVCRIKSGRIRIFYIASATRNRAIVLAVGYRKEGDKRDAYVEFERRVRRGEFDPQFAELGIERPKL
jgi:mRNA-degrading endonuclease RelE of RelBE toxin-antitoxin system